MFGWCVLSCVVCHQRWCEEWHDSAWQWHIDCHSHSYPLTVILSYCQTPCRCPAQPSSLCSTEVTIYIFVLCWKFPKYFLQSAIISGDEWWVSAGGERLSAGQMSEPKSLLVDTRLSGVHYFDVLAVMSWLAVILCNVLVRIINIHTANTAGQEIGYNFRSEKSVQSEATPPPPPPDIR